MQNWCVGGGGWILVNMWCMDKGNILSVRALSSVNHCRYSLCI